MTTSTDLLTDAFTRIRDSVHRAVKGLGDAELADRIDPGGNSVAWLVWHLTRIQDDHVADLAGAEQVWTGEGWAERFGLPFDPGETGYGHSPDEVAAVREVSAEQLTSYHDAVYEKTIAYLGTLADGDFERIVDTNWNPPVTLGVRLVSVISDDLQHVGQASFVRGTLARR
jgi:uncharacterized damage-inducible protein DinB